MPYNKVRGNRRWNTLSNFSGKLAIITGTKESVRSVSVAFLLHSTFCSQIDQWIHRSDRLCGGCYYVESRYPWTLSIQSRVCCSFVRRGNYGSNHRRIFWEKSSIKATRHPDILSDVQLRPQSNAQSDLERLCWDKSMAVKGSPAVKNSAAVLSATMAMK